MSSHLPLSERKLLCASIIIFESMGPLEGTFRRFEKETIFQNLCQFMSQFKEREDVWKDNSESLDTFVKNVLEEFIQSAKKKLWKAPSDLSDIVDAAINEITQKTNNFSCKFCAGKNNPCWGKRNHDHSIVNAAGDCIKPLCKMFDLAVDATNKYYSKFGLKQMKSTVPKILFSTKLLGDYPPDIPFQCAVSGETDMGNKDISEVSLFIYPDGFDWPSYLASLYIFFHECICHAFENTVYQEDEREVSGEGDAFSEGWMAFIAYEVMNKILNGESSTLRLKERIDPDVIDEFISTAQSYHLARKQIYKSQSPGGKLAAFSSQYAYGEKVAKGLLDFLKHSSWCNQPWADFLKISLPLNMIHFQWDEMQEFINSLDYLLGSRKKTKKLRYLSKNAIYKYIPPDTPPEIFDRYRKLTITLRKYLKTYQAHELFDEILTR